MLPDALLLHMVLVRPARAARSHIRCIRSNPTLKIPKSGFAANLIERTRLHVMSVCVSVCAHMVSKARLLAD